MKLYCNKNLNIAIGMGRVNELMLQFRKQIDSLINQAAKACLKGVLTRIHHHEMLLKYCSTTASLWNTVVQWNSRPLVPKVPGANPVIKNLRRFQRFFSYTRQPIRIAVLHLSVFHAALLTISSTQLYKSSVQGKTKHSVIITVVYKGLLSYPDGHCMA